MPGHRRADSSKNGRRPGSRIRAMVGCLAAMGIVLAAGAHVVGPAALPARAAAPATVVTLTFDDGDADQMTAVPIMAQHQLKGTFFIISGQVGAPGYLTQSNLATIAANGNEIGGHTVTHPDLTTVSTDEMRRQVCNDRVTLSNWGYPVTSFAYPYTAWNGAVEDVVRDCGYNSARTLGDIASAHGCSGCDISGSIPPVDPYNLPAVDEIDSTWTLAEMQSVVTTAEAVGGWVPFTFHHVCSGAGCDSLSISPSLFADFVTWLSQRPSTTAVRTVDEVIGGTVKPLVSGPPMSGSTALSNASLETASASGFPQCWMPGGYGSNTVIWARVGSAHDGSYAQRLTETDYVSGDAKLLPTFDTGSCSPTVAAGASYTIGAWYTSTAVTQFALYYRNAAGAWYYWTSSPWFAAASNYTQATWTTPAVPAGATGISFGLSLFSNGTLTTDDYSISATQEAAATPSSRIGVTQAVPGTPKAGKGKAGKRVRPHPTWTAHDRPTLPGRKALKAGQRVAIPMMRG